MLQSVFALTLFGFVLHFASAAASNEVLMGPFGHKTDVGRNCFKTAFLRDRRNIWPGSFSLNIFYSMMKRENELAKLTR